MENNSLCDQLLESLLDIAVEQWRFNNVFQRAMNKLPPTDVPKYQNQFRWFNSQIEKALKLAEFEIVNLEGNAYAEGLPLTVLNLADFENKENLLIEKMIEPIIMRKGKIARTGTVLLGRSKDG